MTTKRFWQFSYETILIAALTLPVIVWGQSLGWDRSSLNLYTIFPLFGLLGYTLFWLQLLGEAFMTHWEANEVPAKKFAAISGPLFFSSVIAHPLLLAIAQFPKSTLAYVASDFRWLVIIAIVSLLIFSLTELAIRVRQGYYMTKFRRVIEGANYIAFILIFLHSSKIGQHLQSGVLQFVWWFYGLTGLIFIGLLMSRFYKKKTESTPGE